MPLLIAHRGNTISFSENTLEAFLSAFEKGADGVELDVHLLDKEIVVVHDYIFDRSKSYPRLEDILEKIHLQGKIEIELKSLNTDILQSLKKVLDKFPQADYSLTTSEIPLCPYIKKIFPQASTDLILHDFLFQDWMSKEVVQQKIIGWGEMSKANGVHIPKKILNQFGKEGLVKELHKAGFIVHSHIYDTNKQIEELSDLSQWEVDQCTFDNIELLKVRKND